MEEWLGNPLQQKLWKERKSRRSAKEDDIRLSILPYVSERTTSSSTSTKSSFCRSEYEETNEQEELSNPHSNLLFAAAYDSDSDFDQLIQASTKLLAHASKKLQSTTFRTVDSLEPDATDCPTVTKSTSKPSKSRKTSFSKNESDTIDCDILCKPTTSQLAKPNNR